MAPTHIAILGLVTWTGLLVTATVSWRTWLTVTGTRYANSFSPSGEDLSPFAQRLSRAHMNCVEHLPFALAVLVLAVATDNAAITDPLALVFLGARVGQSAVHLYSTRNLAVMARAGFLFVQIGVIAAWVTQLALALDA
jgi:uncharacterized MAPEG superfamily protein